MSVHATRNSTPSCPPDFRFPKGFIYLSTTDKINIVAEKLRLQSPPPNVGMDRYLISETPVGTNGLGVCFAICLIGKTKSKPLLGMCHASSYYSFPKVLDLLKQKMKDQGAESIEIYVIGGETPSPFCKKGTIHDEEKIAGLADKDDEIAGVMFNLAEGERNPLSVVVTPEKIYVSKDQDGQEDPLELGSDDGIRIRV